MLYKLVQITTTDNVKPPNKKTRNAMRNADLGKTYKAKNVKELFENLTKKNSS